MDTKICLGFPTTGTIKTITFHSVVAMLKHSKFPYEIVTKEGSILHWNREHIAKMAIERNCSHLLFIDSDMQFEPDAAERLLARDKDIIGVQYNLRKFPKTSTVKVWDENGKELMEDQGNGLLKVASVATGFMLIKTSVFEKLSHPWFFWESDENGEVKTGEDSWFCRKAREAGYEIFCDITIPIKHWGEYAY